LIIFLEKLEIWTNSKAMKSFLTMQQWCDFVKAHIKQLCQTQRYTHNTIRDNNGSVSVLKEDLTKLQELSESTKIPSLWSTLKRKVSIADVLVLTTQSAIIRSRFQSAE